MPLVVIDGPEKAGKSTLAALLAREHGAEVRHFGAEPSAGFLYDLVFARALIEDLAKPHLVVYDRSWASEVVYGSYYHRRRRLVADPWLGEWLYGRVAATLGVRLVLLGPPAEALHRLRSPDDHDIPAGMERVLFAGYAQRWGWEAAERPDDPEWLPWIAASLAARAHKKAAAVPLPPVHYVGPPEPRVLIVGESKNAWGQFPGAFAPFTSWYTTRFGRLFGREALDFGWTNADVLTDEALASMNRPLVIACGTVAQRRLAGLAGELDIVPAPHPSWFYRWGAARTSVPITESRLLDSVRGRLTAAA